MSDYYDLVVENRELREYIKKQALEIVELKSRLGSQEESIRFQIQEEEIKELWKDE